jgi:hypothetical protein
VSGNNRILFVIYPACPVDLSKSFGMKSEERAYFTGVWCSVFVVRCSLFVVRCSLFVVRCLVFVVRCLLFVVCCLLFVVYPVKCEERTYFIGVCCFGLVVLLCVSSVLPGEPLWLHKVSPKVFLVDCGSGLTIKAG